MTIFTKAALAFSLLAGASVVGVGFAQAGPASNVPGGVEAGLIQQAQFNPVERAIRHEAERREMRRDMRREMMRREIRRDMRRDEMRREIRRDRMRRNGY